MTEEQRKLLRAQRFGGGHATIAMASASLIEEEKKKLERASRFGVELPELE